MEETFAHGGKASDSMRPGRGNATQKPRPDGTGIAPAGVSVIIGAAMEPILHVLTGPTAVGKSEWALRWAERHGAEIVSCDALLFYRGMDLGTAKPSPAERARVPHHLIDLLEVTETWDVARYVAAARAACADIAARGRPVLVTGGSGFYLKAFFAPVADDVDVPPPVRAAVAGRLRDEGLAALVAELRRLNPAGLGALDERNPRRVVRALERCMASGRTLAELAAAFGRQPAPFPEWRVRLARLDRPRPELEARITARVEAMLAAGLVEEVRRLRAAGLERNPSAARAIGYRETLAMLDGRLPGGELAAAIARSTRALVRKQRTWFRTQLPPHAVLDAGGVTLEALFPESPAADARTGARG
jgi:tRNA dimethylallyltransferase